MNAIKRAFYTVSILGLSFASVGCGEVANQKCKTTAQCVAQANIKTQPLVVDGGPSNPLNPVCCGGYCLLPASGCDSTYTFQTDDPGYGQCASTTLAKQCPAAPQP